MRIILTPLGQDLIKKLSEENEVYKKTIEEEKMKRTRESMSRNKTVSISDGNNTASIKSPFQSTKFKNPNSLKHRTDLINKLEMDQTTISKEDLKYAKGVHIRQKKINIPKNVTERYNSNSDIKSQTNSILPGFNMTKKTDYTKNETWAGISAGEREKFTIKEVLNETALKSLKTNFVKEKNMRDKLSRIDETKFRSLYEDKNFLEKLEEKLDRKLNPDRINLIKYLNEKNMVSDVLIKKIAEYDEEKINRINKICQIVFHNDEQAKMFQGIIQEKISNNKNREKVEYKSSVENMEKDIEGLADILKNYDKKINNRERYRDVHNDMTKHYWKRYNVDRMVKKIKTRMREKREDKDNKDVPLTQNVNYSKLIHSESSFMDS